MKIILFIAFITISLSACDDRTAEQIGKDLAQEKVDIVKGAGEVIKDQGEGVADTVAQGVGNVISGFATGFDESLFSKEIRVSDAIAPSVLVVTRAQKLDSTRAKPAEGLSLYLTSAEGFSGNLKLIAVSKTGEVGRSISEAKVEKGGANYVDFEFDKRTPFHIVEYFALETSE